MDFDFLVDSYETERLKVLSVWSQFDDTNLNFRPEPRARTPLEHFVHQCVSENLWMTGMLGIEVEGSALPERETKMEFARHYAKTSALRLSQLKTKDRDWFTGSAKFFEVERSRAWVLLRRLTHTAHHRGQLTIYLRLLGKALYSTYGPTADTGGLFQNGAPVIYRYNGVDELLELEEIGGGGSILPGPGDQAPTERPDN